MPSFPASKYVRYKRATAFFLDWLLRARGHRRQDGERVQLETLNKVVTEIAAQPSSLTGKTRKDLPKALAACQCAITLRERVAAFFADDEHAHQHFLGRLRSWLETLKGMKIEFEETQGDKKKVEVESSKFENYYDLLEVDEDYFPDEATYVAERSATNPLKVDRQRLLEEAFAEDMRLEVVYFFVELEELAQEVFDIYEKVKKRQRTLVEAAVVAKLAMDTANGLVATLQLRYPSLEKGLDFLGVVMDSEPEKVASRMNEAYAETCSGLYNDGVYRFIPGMFLMDFLSAGITLEFFIPMIPPSLHYGIKLPPKYFGENDDEEKTPHYVLPDPSHMVLFLLQHLSVLYNTLTYTKVTTFRTYDPKENPDWRLSGCFMAPMNDYFTRHEINISTVFACVCWIKSVAALQGSGGLAESTSLTLQHTTELTAKFEAVAANKPIADKELHGFYQAYAQEIKRSSQNLHLTHTNPLVAGLMMLDHHFEYLVLASDVLFSTCAFRAFGHVYNALVNEGFLRRIPFFEKVLEIYEKMLFTPSRAAAVRGAYYRTLLLSLDVKVTALGAALDSETPALHNDMIKQRRAFLLRDVSKIFRLMTMGDTSFLGGLPSTKMLSKAAGVCAQELMDTRVLSRDMLKVHEDLVDAFSQIGKAVGKPNTDDGYAVAIRLVGLLDALQPDGQVDMRALPGNKRLMRMGKLDGARIRAMCTTVAQVIKVKFVQSVEDLEQRYNIFPAMLETTNTAIVKSKDEDNSGLDGVNASSASTGEAKVASKKKRKKSKKKKSNKGKPNADASIATSGDSNELGEVTSILKQLLISAGSSVEASADKAGVTLLDESLIRTASAAFTRLRDTTIPPYSKADDVLRTCKMVEKLQSFVEEYSSPSAIKSSAWPTRNQLFSQASRVIYLMQRFYRTDHPSMTVPAIAPTRELCSTSPVLTQFVISTARIGNSVGKKDQARELLDLLEKRLLTLRLRWVKPFEFREMVQMYSKARNDMGFGRTLSTDAFRALEWYLVKTADNFESQTALDALDGRPFYLELVTSAFQDTSKLEMMIDSIPGVAYFGDCVKHIVFGGTKDAVDKARDLLVKLAELAGVKLSETNSHYCLTSLRVGDFVFSESGIVRANS